MRTKNKKKGSRNVIDFRGILEAIAIIQRKFKIGIRKPDQIK